MDLNYLFDKSTLNRITFNDSWCTLKSAVTVSDLITNPTLLERIPNWYTYLKLVSSTPIRNIGTIAGNLANGSPIGDFTIILLALNAKITLTNKENESRQLPLKEFYLGYKVLNKLKMRLFQKSHLNYQILKVNLILRKFVKDNT